MRLIDADAICKDCNRTYLGEGYCKYCSIYNMPTIDAVPVVRCKECIYSTEDPIIEGAYSCLFGKRMLLTGDSFCSYCKRREDTACDECG